MTRLGSVANSVSRGPNGYVLAVLAVGVALLARLGLEAFGKFYYLPLIPAVMLPALLASRGATVLAIILSIAANIALVPREGVVDAAVNAVLFACVGVAIGEFGRIGRTARANARALSARLSTRDATISAMLASAAVVSLDRRSRILSMSEPACALFGVREAEVLGQPFSDFVEFFDSAVDRISGGDEFYWPGRRRDGEVFPVGIHMAPIENPDGPPDTILTLTDLSRWRSAEARNQELRDQLNQVWRLNSLGEIAATLSHELNQPLTAAASYLQATQADLGRAGVFADSASRTVELAKNQVLRAGDIIRRARNLLAGDEHRLDPHRVSSMIDDLEPILQLLGPAVGTQLRIVVEDQADWVLADRIQFQQAIVNLVRNAIEAVADHPRREVAILGQAVSTTGYRISVEDSGPGIAPDQIDRMFKPLMTTKAGGMGLGLSVTRTIVERHGGVLSVQTSDLGGAAFAFNLQRLPEPLP
ncbi:ATP-binding protein [Brevundimonas sp.]|jgi:two-component system sensor kinase FixL|uniref:ATP-binding protein n=1 Tax=Brevundimonas sp. TaxID=1871086 RepID=UPI003784BBF7